MCVYRHMDKYFVQIFCIFVLYMLIIDLPPKKFVQNPLGNLFSYRLETTDMTICDCRDFSLPPSDNALM